MQCFLPENKAKAPPALLPPSGDMTHDMIGCFFEGEGNRLPLILIDIIAGDKEGSVAHDNPGIDLFTSHPLDEGVVESYGKVVFLLFNDIAAYGAGSTAADVVNGALQDHVGILRGTNLQGAVPLKFLNDGAGRKRFQTRHKGGVVKSRHGDGFDTCHLFGNGRPDVVSGATGAKHETDGENGEIRGFHGHAELLAWQGGLR